MTGFIETLSLWMTKFGMPVVAAYHLVFGSLFFNTAATDAEGLEKVGDELLIPFHYLFAGRVAIPVTDREGHKEYLFRQQYDYKEEFVFRTTAAAIALPLSIVAGTVVKTIGYASKTAREHYVGMQASLKKFSSKTEYYKRIGIALVKEEEMGEIEPPRFSRRPGEENKLKIDKEALREIVSLLKKHEIPFWIDCGTCLGAQRYGGVIPWDNDIDLSVLEPDFENVRSALSELDPQKYVAQDWSNRDRPNTYIRVYVKETRNHLDIYHFRIDAEAKTAKYVISSENSAFLPKSWKDRERKVCVDTSFDQIFPLKKANFDGITVYVPNKTVEYLQARYGQNIDPVKIFNPITGLYEKDLSHPYWKDSYMR